MLAPFVNRWGLDYDRLKLLEVAAFCVWLVLSTASSAAGPGGCWRSPSPPSSPPRRRCSLHTDQLLSEYPHAAVVAAFIWWMDRIKVRRPLIGATTRQLVVLGLLAAAAFNVRRESVDARRRDRRRPARRAAGRPPRTAAGARAVAHRRRAVRRRSSAAVIGFQLLLPSMLFPDTGDGPRYVPDRLGDYAGVLTQQLGLGRHPLIGTIVLLLAAAGMVVGCIRRPRLDIPLAALTVLSVIAVSTHFRMVGRYYFQVTPWVLYFAAAAVVAGGCGAAPPGPAALGAAPSPLCRWRSWSSCTSPCCPATSPTPASSTAPVGSRSARPIRGSRRSSTPSSDTPRRPTSSPTSGPAR